MVFITAEVLAEYCIYTIKRQKKGKEPVLWIRIKDLGEDHQKQLNLAPNLDLINMA